MHSEQAYEHSNGKKDNKDQPRPPLKKPHTGQHGQQKSDFDRIPGQRGIRMSQLEQADMRVHPPAEEPFRENPANTNSDEAAINQGSAHKA